MAHLEPLTTESSPQLAADFAFFAQILGFVRNSLLTMQRRPDMVKGLDVLTQALMSPDGPVDLGFKRLLAHFASPAAGCQYCEAHSQIAVKIHGIANEKAAAVWEYQSSPLYSEAKLNMWRWIMH